MSLQPIGTITLLAMTLRISASHQTAVTVKIIVRSVILSGNLIWSFQQPHSL